MHSVVISTLITTQIWRTSMFWCDIGCVCAGCVEEERRQWSFLEPSFLSQLNANCCCIHPLPLSIYLYACYCCLVHVDLRFLGLLLCRKGVVWRRPSCLNWMQIVVMFVPCHYPFNYMHVIVVLFMLISDFLDFCCAVREWCAWRKVGMLRVGVSVNLWLIWWLDISSHLTVWRVSPIAPVLLWKVSTEHNLCYFIDSMIWKLDPSCFCSHHATDSWTLRTWIWRGLLGFLCKIGSGFWRVVKIPTILWWHRICCNLLPALTPNALQANFVRQVLRVPLLVWTHSVSNHGLAEGVWYNVCREACGTFDERSGWFPMWLCAIPKCRIISLNLIFHWICSETMPKNYHTS